MQPDAEVAIQERVQAWKMKDIDERQPLQGTR